jgi:hypothetical protein
MIDINKKYTTRDGRMVRIYATDHGGTYPIVGAVKSSKGWDAQLWREGGVTSFYNTPHNDDLIEVKQPMGDEEALLLADGFLMTTPIGRPFAIDLIQFVRQHGKEILGL